MIEKYFFEELQYLREAGREFAQAYPERARYLNIEDIDDRDPYVERLFEGFAFLTGKIRQKLDDELPELTRSLLGLLWPHFLRPIPSLAILEFQPKTGAVQGKQAISRDTEVDSALVRGGISCRFRTCYDVEIRPIRLETASLRPAEDGNTLITFRFRTEGPMDFRALGFDAPLRLFIHDLDAPTTHALHLFLTRHVRRVVLRTAGGRSETATLRGQEWVQPAGFALKDGLLPYTDYSFPGYRLLQEFFAYRDKFFFFDLCGLDRLNPSEDVEGFEVEIAFNRRFSDTRRVEAENFRLHCTPIINLFQRDAEPIRVDYLNAEYRVVASVRRPPESIEVYAIDEVEGIKTGAGERSVYVPFYSFKHSLTESGRKQGGRYYHTSIRPRIVKHEALGEGFGGLETYISIVDAGAGVDNLVEETLSIKATCTNRTLPRRELGVGDICYPTPDVPEFVTFRNLTRPTAPIYPPLEGRFEWNLISHLALNYLSLSNIDALKGILALYNWNQSESNRRRITGIRSVEFKPKEMLYRGAIIRGVHATVEVIRENFEDGEGDLHLFGWVMSEFLGLYSSINSFTQLTIECPSGERFEWPPKTGKSLPL
jgi:type VI secretion system protein ImpG